MEESELWVCSTSVEGSSVVEKRRVVAVVATLFVMRLRRMALGEKAVDVFMVDVIAMAKVEAAAILRFILYCLGGAQNFVSR